jgi:hypothetical protein
MRLARPAGVDPRAHAQSASPLSVCPAGKHKRNHVTKKGLMSKKKKEIHDTNLRELVATAGLGSAATVSLLEVLL